MPFPVTDTPVLAQRNLNDTGKVCNNIHGTTYAGGYLYGSCRYSPLIMRMPANDYTNYDVVTMDDIVTICNMDTLVYAGGKLWTIGGFTSQGAAHVDADLTNRVYCPDSAINGGSPSCADADYYYGGSSFISKFRLSDGAMVLHRDVAGDVGPPWGQAHSMVEDGAYLYISLVVGDEAGGYFCKVRKSDLVTVAHIAIPKATDDMTQDANYCYLGIEISSTMSPYPGYNIGAMQIKKSDLSVVTLPKFESEGNDTVSYGSLYFGGYLFDIKTNNHVYVMSCQNPGMTLVKDYRITGITEPEPPYNRLINEIVRDDDGYFHLTLWYSQMPVLAHFSSWIKVAFDLTFTDVPTVVTGAMSLVGKRAMRLNGDVRDAGGLPVTETGFYFDGSNPPTTKIAVGSGLGPYTYDASGLIEATPYYARSYAVNSKGEGQGLVVTATTLAASNYVAGIVTLNGDLVVEAKITLIRTSTNLVIATTTSAADGSYLFDNLVSGAQYHVCVEYDSGLQKYNAESKPFVTPTYD